MAEKTQAEVLDDQALEELAELSDELEDIEPTAETTDDVDDESDGDEESFTTPVALAKELGVDPKRLRGWLRENFTRPLAEKNTSWRLTDDMVDAARDRFSTTEDDESDVEEVVEV